MSHFFRLCPKLRHHTQAKSNLTTHLVSVTFYGIPLVKIETAIIT